MSKDYTMLKDYYQRTFKEFDESKGNKAVKWNWAAACFGAFWALSKGCTKNGMLFLVLQILFTAGSGGPGAGVFFIYYGCRGNWLFYKKITENKDIWA